MKAVWGMLLKKIGDGKLYWARFSHGHYVIL